MRRMELRLRKYEFSNDFSMNEFRMNPSIKFNARELQLKEEDKKDNLRVFSMQCNVTIESTKENKTPIRLDIIVEGMFEFRDEENEAIDKFMKLGAPEIVYAQTRSLVTSLTAQAGGVSTIILPIIDFERQNQGNLNNAN
jgi:preprotein translocase subunit SecB